MPVKRLSVLGRTPASCALCFSMWRMAALTFAQMLSASDVVEQPVEPRLGGQIKDALGAAGGGLVHARAAGCEGTGFLQLGALSRELSPPAWGWSGGSQPVPG